jgi:Type III restriction enzyme, res subunit
MTTLNSSSPQHSYNLIPPFSIEGLEEELFREDEGLKNESTVNPISSSISGSSSSQSISTIQMIGSQSIGATPASTSPTSSIAECRWDFISMTYSDLSEKIHKKDKFLQEIISKPHLYPRFIEKIEYLISLATNKKTILKEPEKIVLIWGIQNFKMPKNVPPSYLLERLSLVGLYRRIQSDVFLTDIISSIFNGHPSWLELFLDENLPINGDHQHTLKCIQLILEMKNYFISDLIRIVKSSSKLPILIYDNFNDNLFIHSSFNGTELYKVAKERAEKEKSKILKKNYIQLETTIKFLGDQTNIKYNYFKYFFLNPDLIAHQTKIAIEYLEALFKSLLLLLPTKETAALLEKISPSFQEFLLNDLTKIMITPNLTQRQEELLEWHANFYEKFSLQTDVSQVLKFSPTQEIIIFCNGLFRDVIPKERAFQELLNKLHNHCAIAVALFQNKKFQTIIDLGNKFILDIASQIIKDQSFNNINPKRLALFEWFIQNVERPREIPDNFLLNILTLPCRSNENEKKLDYRSSLLSKILTGQKSWFTLLYSVNAYATFEEFLNKTDISRRCFKEIIDHFPSYIPILTSFMIEGKIPVGFLNNATDINNMVNSRLILNESISNQTNVLHLLHAIRNKTAAFGVNFNKLSKRQELLKIRIFLIDAERREPNLQSTTKQILCVLTDLYTALQIEEKEIGETLRSFSIENIHFQNFINFILFSEVQVDFANFYRIVEKIHHSLTNASYANNLTIENSSSTSTTSLTTPDPVDEPMPLASNVVSSLSSEPLELSKFRAKDVSSLYKDLVERLLSVWTYEKIQVNLRRLMAFSEGEKNINLSLAVGNDLSPDEKGIGLILKPFYDFLTVNSSSPLAQAVVKDAIESLSLLSEETASFSEFLNRIFANKESDTNFILSFLSQEQAKKQTLSNFKIEQGIGPLDSSKPELLYAIRDLLFFFSLQELKLRANNPQKILRKPNEYQQKPAFLVYTQKDQTVLYPLTVIKGGPSQTIVAIGHDNRERKAQSLLENLFVGKTIADSSCVPITPVELEKLQEKYQQTTSPSFYILSPIPNSQLETHKEEPSLSLAVQPNAPKRQHSAVRGEQTEANSPPPKKRENPSTLSLDMGKNRHLSPSSITPSSTPVVASEGGGSSSSAVPNFVLDDSIPRLKKRGRNGNSDGEEEGKEESSVKKKKGQKGEEPLVGYQPLDAPDQPPLKTAPKKSNSDLKFNLGITRASHISSHIDDTGDPFDSLINSQLCAPALHRIQEIVLFSNLHSLEELLKKTTSIRQKLGKPPLVGEIAFDDKQLKEYQKKGVLEYVNDAHNELGIILAFAPGLGKTKAACEAIRQTQKREGSGRPVLVIAPNSLLMQWKEALIKQQFFSRISYYTTLINNYENLIDEQQQTFLKCYSEFVISHENQLQLLESQKTGLEKKEKSILR